MIVVGVRGCTIKEDIFKLDLPFQILDGDVVATEKHILHAINQARSKEPITNSFWMEILVRASAQRQISNAIEIIGVKTGEGRNVCIVCPDEDTLKEILKYTGGRIDNSVLDLNLEKLKRIRRVFHIEEEYFKDREDVVKRLCEKISVMEIVK
ncbi:MAG TPA: hypothetical protein EYH15_04770 [Methanothermococcus okinawensis]|uniref:Uncharacterized protein n=1 Tax=Methanothermococcus okinawensis TaxID=155863 RepID=A0A832ZJF6_9EURY|nr:hypothetical protein [Methanococcaceae archaeon]HIP84782.1 hypothetical protein [Methanothermococcus okinawensis]HIP91244.1 hypothetical protein [Methanothermococcus okinawensis]